MKNIEDLVQWCLKHRRRHVFKDWPEYKIRAHLLEAYQNRTLYVEFNKAGEIVGMLSGQQIFHVSHMLTTESGVMSKLLNKLWLNTKGFMYKAYRQSKQKEVYYNKPEQLLSKL